jgi:cleavage and polyadenylation specificity factor subunit 3
MQLLVVLHLPSTSGVSADDMLYKEDDVARSMEKIEQVNYHQQLQHNGIKFWCYNAGHVLGAAMFMVEIGGVRVR